MTRTRIAWVAKAASVVLLSGVVAAATGFTPSLSASSSSPGTVTATAGGSTSSSTAASSETTGKGSKADKVTFTVSLSGVPGGLVLGAARVLPVTVTNGPGNKSKTTMRLTSISVVPAAAGTGCGTENLSVGAYQAPAAPTAGHFLDSGQAVTVDIPISLIDSPWLQDACKGSSFPVTVTARAEVFK